MAKNTIKDPLHFVALGYQDYIASRFLINNNYVIQGITLASSAVEKYIKSILISLGKPLAKVHLDNLQRLKEQFLGTTYKKLFDYFDDIFLSILGKAYKFRYYDNVEAPDTIGFFTNQFLGELDFTINAFERLVSMTDQSGNVIPTHYQRAVNERNADLFFKNYVLSNIQKNDFMQSKSQAFGLHFNPVKNEIILIKFKEEMQVPYEGKIQTIEVSA